MNQARPTASAPFLRRAFGWWLAQVKHVLPPTIFFFVGFNLILWTKRLILEEHGVEFSGFLTATLAALLVGKAIEYRWAEGRSERFAEIADELVQLKVDVILTHNTPPVLAAKEATSVIPIVFASAGDPVGTGVVAS